MHMLNEMLHARIKIYFLINLRVHQKKGGIHEISSQFMETSS